MEHSTPMPSVCPLLLAVAALAAGLIETGCTFEPRIPSGTIRCAADNDCPASFVCQLHLDAGRACCARGACDGETEAGASDGGTGERAVSRHDAADAAPDAARVIDADMVVPPKPMPAADAAAAMDRGASPDGGDLASLVTCGPYNTPPAGVSGQEVLCTVRAEDTSVTVYIDDITNHDPVTTRAEGLCWVDTRFGSDTTDPMTGAARPLPPASIDLLAAAVDQFKKVCAGHGGRMVGVMATGWARQATNQADVATKLKERTGLALDVPTPAQELAQAYFGVTRNRRRFLMVDRRSVEPQLIVWPSSASAPVVYRMPMTSTDADTMFFSNPMFAGGPFDAARMPLRSQLKAGLDPSILELRTLVSTGQIETTMVVGPANAMVPFAVDGRLRAAGSWNDVATVERKLSAATVTLTPDAALTLTPFGRVFGLVRPEALDLFFPSIDAAQFAQLRTDPIRRAYGRELMFVTTLLDILADETDATEFGFVFAFPHFGYLYGKLLPPPS